MAFYIGTYINGRGLSSAMRFENKRAFWLYCDEVNTCRDTTVRASMTITELCETIEDKGPGFGSRYYRRISEKETHGLLVFL